MQSVQLKRRAFITLLGGAAAAAWPLAVRAQQGERTRQVGVLIGVADDAQGQARLAAFHKGMQELGWTEGRNIQFETRFSGGDGGRARAYSTELVAMKPDAIVANTAPEETLAGLMRPRVSVRGSVRSSSRR